jgi:hypothetical protein
MVNSDSLVVETSKSYSDFLCDLGHLHLCLTISPFVAVVLQDRLSFIWWYVYTHNPLGAMCLSQIPSVTAAAEIAGKFIMGNGVASSFRPRKYYRVPKETLETFLDDVEQLINFFIIEFQRVLFAENVAATVAVCSPQMFSRSYALSLS